MRLRLVPLLVVAPLLAAGWCGPTPPAPPDQPGDCENGPGAASVEVGTGQDGFVPLADGATTKLNFGAQGGEHVWTSVKAAGFGDRSVKIALVAKDVFSGRTVGEGDAFGVRLNAISGAAKGTCEFHGVPLFLDGHFDASGGLVELTGTVTANDGTTATGSRRIWIGAAMPACVPEDGVTPTVAPVDVGAQTNVEIQDSDTLVPWPDTPPQLELEADTTGLATSTLRLHAELRAESVSDDAPPFATADSAGGYEPEPRMSGSPPACRTSVSVLLPLDGVGSGPLDARLLVTADDGAGHTATAVRHVTIQLP